MVGNPDTKGDITESGLLLGAGVLPFTFSPEGELFFLLVPGWRGSETWSPFERGVKYCDNKDVLRTASREYSINK